MYQMSAGFFVLPEAGQKPVIQRMVRHSSRLLLFVLSLCLLKGCALARMDQSLAAGVINHTDVELVAEGLPTYLLLLDGLVENWPRSASLLGSAASLYSAYAGSFVEDDDRARALQQRALDYAQRSVCEQNHRLCNCASLPVPALERELERLHRNDVPMLYMLGSVWAGWIQENSGDWNAVAQLARVQIIFERVVALDESHEMGQAHMYLGVLHSLLPAALGGRPETAKMHFERAISLSDGHNLMARVLYAERFARMKFDRRLHDLQLEKVLESDPRHPGLTLQNVYAQREAERLLAESDDYFFE